MTSTLLTSREVRVVVPLTGVDTEHREVSSLLSPQCEPRPVSGPSSDLWPQAARAWG